MTNPVTPPARPAEMDKAYEHQPVEQSLYPWWERSGFFAPRADAPKPPFVISIPPPNVTGELHLGHAMFVTIEDLMVRWRRMQGFQTLWVPGTDHAGIATQSQVEKLLRSEGTTREAVGREEFLRRTWEWKEKYGGEIQNQLRRLGASCDWDRERFTLDAGLSRSVHTAFKRLYDDGLIYKGTYLVNWSPNLGTAVSDLEVEYETRNVSIWYVRYPVVGDRGQGTGDGGSDAAPFGHAWGSGRWAEGVTEWITVATTRPETILGDTAVATAHGDERFAHLLGRQAILPALGRAIPIIADEYVDKEFGSGAVKITPAHDKNDYEVGKRHGLPQITILNRDATLNAEGGPYAGMDRFAARKAMLADLEKEGLLVKTEPHTMSVGISQRGGEVIEPLLSEQWFVKVRPLAELAMAAVREGRTKIIPERFEKVYFHWMENLEDWCISRQLWWGHRIPVWYMPDGTMVVPGPDEAPPEGATQDPDVLDTWFSSGIWPFSTLGWPDETPDLKTFYPTSVMETGYDIIFFWVARMMMMGCYLTGVEPFHTIYLHGLVRDEHGRKMSKSYGNVVNPLVIMGDQGTDALRFTLATSGTPGQDMNLNPQRIESARNFANKIWNITRFVISKLQIADFKLQIAQSEAQSAIYNLQSAMSLADRWILSRYSRLCLDVDRLLESYNFGEAGRQMHDFLWGEFADWYVEIAKVQLEGDAAQQQATRAVLYTVLEGSLRLLHPYIPFVTEEVWQYLTRVEGVAPGPEHSLMLASYPTGDEALVSDAAEADWGLVQELIVAIRNIRSEYKVEPARWVAATVVAGERAAMLRGQAALIARLGRVDAERLTIVESLDAKPGQSAAIVIGTLEAYLPLAGLIDLEAERARLAKELDQAEADVARREAKLANEGFVAKAPANVVQRERDSLETARAALATLRGRIAEL
ncbi:valine--tRNA ligase [Oscillochloris sp. ZM17-4]|uniref:valine--tRNA ligase n=1 Tax=Oscillochloris sp. ZM17-4 TaxID=2866714 RepID=UPI001C7383E8|nr:valine--tRNA ligase [Oscillochloris sp. ZM17-4]MBX0326532.1 valine--tRNA ligase [Oscillochloris sp. ZM17-4]